MKAQMKAADRSGAPLARHRRRATSCAAGTGRRVRDRSRRRAPTTSEPVPRRRRLVDRPSDALPTAILRWTADDRATVMRTALRAASCATERRRPRPCRVCGWVARRREHGEHLAFVDLRDHTGVVQCVVDGAARPAQRVRRAGHRHRPRRGPRARSTRASPPARSRSATATVEILSAAEPPPFPLDDRADDVDEMSACATATSTCAASACSATCASGPRSTRAIRARDGAPGLRRDRDADAHRVDARGRPRLRGAVAPAARQRSTPCRRARSCSSSCAWSAASTATTRSPAACATRTCAPTASSSSCSSTPRPASSTRTTCSAFISEAVLAAAEAVTGRAARRRSRSMTWHEAHGALRHRQARRALRHGAGRAHRRCSPPPSSTRSRPPCVKGIRVPGRRGDYGRNQLDGLTDQAKRCGAKGLVWMRVEARAARSTRRSPSSCPTTSRPALRRRARAPSPATSCCSWPTSGRTACAGARPAAPRPRPPAGERGRPTTSSGSSTSRCSRRSTTTADPMPAHHPFTMPHPDDLDLLDVRTPTCSRARQAYDLVLNGWELGSGSVRIHAPDIQQRIFDAARHRDEEAAGEVRLPARRRSATARRRTPASPSASTGSSRCSPARRTSARSSPSRRRSRAPTRMTGAPTADRRRRSSPSWACGCCPAPTA